MRKSTITILRKLGFIVQLQDNKSTDYITIGLLVNDFNYRIVCTKQLNIMTGEIKTERLPLLTIAKLYLFGEE